MDTSGHHQGDYNIFAQRSRWTTAFYAANITPVAPFTNMD